MENMKRALSAFMALVLVLGMLPGVPMFAGAEEVETQPETVAVETTEAATTPETTVPEESVPETTVPEESIPETTVAEEIIPETTVAEETVPETTVPEETVPEETVSEETAAVEAAEDLNADAEAADAVINKEVTNILVSAATNYTYVGAQVKLTAKLTPEDADSPEVLFYVVDETEEEEEAEPVAVAEDTGLPYDQQILEKKGVLIVTEPCTLTIAAKAIQGTEVYDSAIQEEGGKVTITFVDYAMQINELAIDKDNWYEGILRVMTGKKLALSANYLVNGEAAPHLPGVNPDITWYLEEGDEEYASVKVNSDNCMEVEVTAKTVTESKTVTLHARENTLGTVDSIQITVYPIPYKVGIYQGEEEVTNDSIVIPLVASEINAMRAEGIEYLELPLTAKVWPVEAEEPMVWTASDGLVQIVHPDKEGEEELLPAAEEDEEEPEKDTTQATLRVYFYEGDTTITIASKNYPDVKSTVKIIRKWSLSAEEIDFDLETEQLQTKGIGLISGQSFKLKVYDIRDKEKPVLLDDEIVEWSLSEEDQEYATVSEDGKLTAKKGLSVGAEVTVKCTVINNKAATKELKVAIRPLGKEVRILPGDLASEALDDELVINGMTIPVDTTDGCVPFALEAQVHPCGEDMVGALQKVTWKSSNTSIATYDEVTEKIKWAGKNGTVTFTVTAADGSGKKASVSLKFCVMATGLEILENKDKLFLRSGESWTMDVKFTGNPTDKSVSWYLLGEDDGLYATLSAKGKLTAKTVYEEHTVTVLAMANDGSGVHDILQVLIKPKKDGILVLKSDSEFVEGYENYVTMTTQIIPVYEEIDLDAYILGFEDEGEETVSWKSSNSKVASVDEDGVVSVLKPGKVTITATSAYDTKNRATVTLQCVSLVDTIEWTHNHEQHALACGKSLTLKAKAYDLEGKTPTISKLQWVIADDGARYAKVSNGKVTAYADALAYDKEPVTITVLALATDGSKIFADWEITIYPIVQSVTIEQPEEVYVNMPSKGTNTYVMITPGVDSLQLNAKIFPANAAPDVTWKSSNAKIASIDEYGELTVHKAGTVTITATAADGSGKKATYKLSILAVPDEIEFEMDYLAIAGGKNLKMKPVLFDGNGDKITGKKFEWKVAAVEGEDDGTAYVTSISGGTLKTKKVTSPKVVEVTVRTVEKNDEWEIELTVPVEIYPAATAVKILDESDTELGLSHWADLADEQLQLQALVTGKANEMPFDGVTWKSSNTKIATVDEAGLVTFLKTGTVTIYAYAADGTSVKDYVKLTIRK